ncbi:MAG: AAA family ATPase, partial [Methanobrevibacter sp.]|nr:AAA family ATPase [Methanobrevibacter sp.]
MLLYRAHIENFRNIDHININFSDFNVLIGENNIGKTNILTAINKVLSKNVYFKEDDFKILEKPIIIELSFNNLSEEDKAAFFDFEGLYNPEDEDITIKTIGTWRSTIGNADISVNFIRKDLKEDEQEVKPVTKAFRKTLSSLYISAHRNYSKNMDSKGIFELLRLFAPYQTMPLDSLK